jgi:hypothetical protein
MEYIKSTLVPIRGNWHADKTKLRLKFSELTESDLYYPIGKKEVMYQKVQEKLNINRLDLDKIISEL